MKSAEERARQYDREWDVGVEGRARLARLLEEHEADIRADERAKVIAEVASADGPRCGHCSEFGLRVKDGRLVYLWGEQEDEQSLSREVSVAIAHEVLGTTAAAALDSEGSAEPTETGYTRAQFAAAVDEAHAALHEAEESMRRADAAGWAAMLDIQRAHEALHHVGAGVPRVGCATPDPEAQRVVTDLRKLVEQALSCGHKVEDLIGGTDPATKRPLVTKCGACLAERQTEIAAANRLRHEATHRADEIEAEAVREGSKLRFGDAIRHAREAWEDIGRAFTAKSSEARKVDAAAWLLVAQRMLEREADR